MSRTPEERWLGIGPQTPKREEPNPLVEELQKAGATAREAVTVMRQAGAAVLVLNTQKTRLVEALEAVTKELRDVLKDSGGCDHSVGICWCDTIRALELADEALKNAKE